MNEQDLSNIVVLHENKAMHMWEVAIRMPDRDETVGYFGTFLEATGVRFAVAQTLMLMAKGRLTSNKLEELK